MGAGAIQIFSPVGNILAKLNGFCNSQADWLFGHFNYDLKNEIENLSSKGAGNIGFPEAFLFQPSIVIELKGSAATISSVTTPPDEIFVQIANYPLPGGSISKESLVVRAGMERDIYVASIRQIKEHIIRGDCYELNFCQEFFAQNADINPCAVYNNLVQLSPNPFSCYYKLDDKFLMCASPERYIKKMGNVIISQPIKGTAKRDTGNPVADEQLKGTLKNSQKERSENVMVVDLVRNDLSRICKEGTVITEELFGVYSFPQVHHLVSTIKGVLTEGIGLANILRASFPMGSMTGAPKKRVMDLIELYEPTKRGIFSGTVGYITPDGDFDFNVVIRSIMYNAQTRYLNYLVGSGITFYSDPESEYEECLIKAAAIEKVLKQGTY